MEAEIYPADAVDALVDSVSESAGEAMEAARDAKDAADAVAKSLSPPVDPDGVTIGDIARALGWPGE